MINSDHLKRAAAVAAAALLTACASAPKTNSALETARSQYQRAAGEPQIARVATVELQKAEAALRRAESALQADAERSTVEHHAYIASRQTETAIEAARIAAADERVRAAQAQRERIVLDARTREADAQRERAQQSLTQAEQARRIAEEQQARAEASRKQAEAARGQAEAARAQAQAANQRAATQLAEAQSARAAATAAEERAQRLSRELEQLQAKKTDRGMVVTMSDVLFDTGRADLKPGAQRTLDELARFLREYPERTVMIEGHTDSVGSARFNQQLSQDRAQSVKNALVSRGIDQNRISVRGFGEHMPLVGNETPAGRQQNRRVEIVLPDVS